MKKGFIAFVMALLFLPACGAGISEEGGILLETLAVDFDMDHVFNGADNCPFVSNPDQGDADLDRIGNACDLNTDWTYEYSGAAAANSSILLE